MLPSRSRLWYHPWTAKNTRRQRLTGPLRLAFSLARRPARVRGRAAVGFPRRPSECDLVRSVFQAGVRASPAGRGHARLREAVVLLFPLVSGSQTHFAVVLRDASSCFSGVSRRRPTAGVCVCSSACILFHVDERRAKSCRHAGQRQTLFIRLCTSSTNPRRVLACRISARIPFGRRLRIPFCAPCGSRPQRKR